MSNDPITPYAGTGGYSDNDASRDAAEALVESGQLAVQQQRVYDYVKNAGPLGATTAEMRDEGKGFHHGRVSSAATTLHKAGLLAKLAEKRKGSGVYVLPEYVADRPTVKPGSNKGRGSAPQMQRIEVPVPTKVPLSAEDRDFVATVRAKVTTRAEADALPMKPQTVLRLLNIIRDVSA